MTMDFYVSKLGKPGNPGTAEMPFAGIEEARDAVRAYLEKKNVGAGAVTVHILEGEYRAYGLDLIGSGPLEG